MGPLAAAQTEKVAPFPKVVCDDDLSFEAIRQEVPRLLWLESLLDTFRVVLFNGHKKCDILGSQREVGLDERHVTSVVAVASGLLTVGRVRWRTISWVTPRSQITRTVTFSCSMTDSWPLLKIMATNFLAESGVILSSLL